ncbi:MAG: hypothetical protein WBG92_03270 [Thiohalocapsa sp.]
MGSRAVIVHRSRTRLRLRVPDRRRDLAFFVPLYESLRKIPGVTEVVINPITASVLLIFPDGYCDAIETAVGRDAALTFEQVSGTAKSSPAAMKGPSGASDSVASRRILRVTDLRTILFLLTLGVAVHQVLRGKLLAAALSLLWFGYDLVSHAKTDSSAEENRETK